MNKEIGLAIFVTGVTVLFAKDILTAIGVTFAVIGMQVWYEETH